MKVLFWVQHLLGVGHLARAAVLARALRAEGIHVTAALGGVVPDGFRSFADRTVLLPPVRASDTAYSGLVTASGVAPDDAFWRSRREALLLAEPDADLVLVEAWPFGRRPFTPELLALLDSTDAPAVISVRDIVQARAENRMRETVIHARRVDAILVHADPALATLEASFPLASELPCQVVHTGYVAPDRAVEPRFTSDVVVSAGGGAFGEPLLATAARVARLRPQLTFTLARGPNGPPAHRLARVDNLTVVDSLDNLADHLAGAKASISQCGYNTTLDILRSGVRSVLVPSDTHGQTEQLTRATALAAAGRATVVPETELTPEALALALDASLASPEPRADYDLNGARRTAAFIRDRLA